MKPPKGFIFILLAMLALIGGASWFIIATAMHIFPLQATAIAHYGWIPFVIFPVLLIGTMSLRNYKYIPATKYTYIAGMQWLPFLIYLFLTAATVRIYDALGSHTLTSAQVAVFLFFVVIIVMVIGTIQSLRYHVATYEIKAPLLKNLWSDKTIVMVSNIPARSKTV